MSSIDSEAITSIPVSIPYPTDPKTLKTISNTLKDNEFYIKESGRVPIRNSSDFEQDLKSNNFQTGEGSR